MWVVKLTDKQLEVLKAVLRAEEHLGPALRGALEALDLARVLLAEGAVTVRDVEDVWAHWFSESLVLRLGVDRMARLVDELNALVPAAGASGLPLCGA